MATPNLGVVANALFEGFLAPIVLGGALVPGRPIGAKAALSLTDDQMITDFEKASLVSLGRVRVGRKLVPIDRVEGISGAQWALGAALHDLVQSTHPDLSGLFRSNAPRRVLDLVDAVLARVPGPATAREALDRHTLFSRVLDIVRTDTKVSWWVGSATYLGADPPARVTAWRTVRRVRLETTPRPLLDLPTAGGPAPPERFVGALEVFLHRTPLTDLATCCRKAPVLRFSDETLGLIASRAGRTMVLRALAGQPDEAVDLALARATQPLIGPQPTPHLVAALSLLAERSLASAQSVLGSNDAAMRPHREPQALFAQGIGAYAARAFVGLHGDTFTPAERTALLALLRPASEMPSVAPVARLLDAALATATSSGAPA